MVGRTLVGSWTPCGNQDLPRSVPPSALPSSISRTEQDGVRTHADLAGLDSSTTNAASFSVCTELGGIEVSFNDSSLGLGSGVVAGG